MKVKRIRLSKWIPLFLMYIGIIDVVIRCWLVGFSHGLKYALHDPGKTMFHIIILPLAVHLYFRLFLVKGTYVAYKKLEPLKKKVFNGMAIVFVFLGLNAIFTHEEAWRCQCGIKSHAFIMPYDVKEKSKIASLITIREDIYNILTADAPEKAKADSVSVLKAQYRNITRTNCDTCSILTEGSIYTFWSVGESMIGVLFCIGMLLSVVFVSMSSSFKEGKMVDVLILVALIVAPWIPLRIYSESYINFAGLDTGIAMAIIYGAFVAVIFAAVAYFSKQMSATLQKKISMGYAIFAGVISVGGAINEDVIRIPFLAIYAVGTYGTLFTFLVILLPLIVVLLSPNASMDLTKSVKND